MPIAKAIRVVLDTNILISTLINPSSELSGILKNVAEGIIINYISDDILGEYTRVTCRKKIADRVPEPERKRFIALVEELSVKITPRHKLEVIREDPADNRILECAIEAKADYIITGDQHLLKLKEHKGIRILTPQEFIKKR
ncbi:MAG: putative toxin-antitoxin system toxin component, PIN family [Candidatus Altiarchaeota archaeon]